MMNSKPIAQNYKWYALNRITCKQLDMKLFLMIKEWWLRTSQLHLSWEMSCIQCQGTL